MTKPHKYHAWETLEDLIDNDGCRGRMVRYSEFYEYECDYEYSGDIDCGECIFGSWGGTLDPRVNPNGGENNDDEKGN